MQIIFVKETEKMFWEEREEIFNISNEGIHEGFCSRGKITEANMKGVGRKAKDSLVLSLYSEIQMGGRKVGFITEKEESTTTNVALRSNLPYHTSDHRW